MTTAETHGACIILLAALGACGGDGEVDACKLDGQAPFVMVGQGRTAYAPITDGAMIPVEAGPQGGHHIWLALRTKGLASRGSVISVTGRADEIPATVGPFNTIFELHPAADGSCEVSGIRFQIDQDIPVAMFNGKAMELTVQISDKAGASAEDSASVIPTL